MGSVEEWDIMEGSLEHGAGVSPSKVKVSIKGSRSQGTHWNGFRPSLWKPVGKTLGTANPTLSKQGWWTPTSRPAQPCSALQNLTTRSVCAHHPWLTSKLPNKVVWLWAGNSVWNNLD